MKKSDLKTGMILVNSEGEDYKVQLDMQGTDILTGVTSGRWSSLSSYNENLESGLLPNVMSIYEGQVYCLEGRGRFLWERPEKVEELTVAEISERLGVKIKVIEG